VENFKRTSPYVDMVPALQDFFWHPIDSTATLAEVIKLTTEHKSAIVSEKRDKRIDDVVKRKRFRKAHNIDENEGIAGWLQGGSGVVDPEEEAEAQAAAAAAADATTEAAPTGDNALPAAAEGEGKRKKFLGIF
jgi:hypothetical protein